MIHVNKTFPAAALPTLFSPSLVVFIVIWTYLVCLIDLCVIKSLRRICLGVKARSQHMTFRCNVESTSLTTSVTCAWLSDVATQPSSFSNPLP